jgi:hypothetical protein
VVLTSQKWDDKQWYGYQVKIQTIKIGEIKGFKEQIGEMQQKKWNILARNGKIRTYGIRLRMITSY